MSELKLRREGENLNDLQELKNLLKDLNLDRQNHTLDRPKANIVVTKRLDQQQPLRQLEQPSETPNLKDLDKNYVKELKHDLKECNPNYKLGRKWQVNCQRCVPAFEMRRRGYDVTVLPRENGLDRSGLSRNPFLVWKNPEVVHAEGNGKQDIEKNMAKWGDGARAQIVVMWKPGLNGHTFFAEQVNGKTRFYDPQTGSTDVSKYFDRAMPGSVRFCRTDKLEPNEKILDCCRRV